MSDSAALTQVAPPMARFTDHVHAMTARMACQTTAMGLENLLSNLRRLRVPAEFEESFNRIALQLSEGLQLVRNLEATFAGITAKQAEEGTL